LEKLRAEAALLVNFPDVQCRYILFRYCFMAKPVHLMRTTRPDLMSDFIDELEKIQINIVESLFRLQIELFFFNLVCFPSVKGGIGIQKTRNVCPAIYTASISLFMHTASCPVKIEGLEYPCPGSHPSLAGIHRNL
jgi:hypothetical protein